MADIAKVITIIGSSPESFAKAADAAVQEASKTVRDIHGADVVKMSAVVEGDRITQYRTTVHIAFGVEREASFCRVRACLDWQRGHLPELRHRKRRDRAFLPGLRRLAR